MKAENIQKILSNVIVAPSKWELDEIVYYDRHSNPKTLLAFLQRTKELHSKKTKITKEESIELTHLLELLEDLDQDECEEMLSVNDEIAKETFIENLSKISALEVLTNGKMSFETMNTACKLSPTDFILCAKRTQDLINAIKGLVIKGETLSNDIASA